MQRRYHPRIELGARATLQLPIRLLVPTRLLVRTLIDHRHKGIGNGNDPGP